MDSLIPQQYDPDAALYGNMSTLALASGSIYAAVTIDRTSGALYAGGADGSSGVWQWAIRSGAATVAGSFSSQAIAQSTTRHDVLPDLTSEGTNLLA